jgi:hypothetical protein
MDSASPKALSTAICRCCASAEDVISFQEIPDVFFQSVLKDF